MEKAKKLQKIAQRVKACQACPLWQQATNPVAGQGNSKAQIVFIGEAPGYWEDQKGIPFCGPAGNLLNQFLSEINLQREEVFIANILKHRPPNNRDPLPDEIKACTPYLKEQLLIIQPRLVVTLGRFALNYFLPGTYISKEHGKVKKISWQGLSLALCPLFHPAAALRSSSVLAELKADFLKIPKIIGDLKEKGKNQELPNQKLQITQESLF